MNLVESWAHETLWEAERSQTKGKWMMMIVNVSFHHFSAMNDDVNCSSHRLQSPHTCGPDLCIFNNFRFYCSPLRNKNSSVGLVSATQKLIKILFSIFNKLCSLGNMKYDVCAQRDFRDGLDWDREVSWIHTKAIKMPFSHPPLRTHHNKNGPNMNLSSAFNLPHPPILFFLPMFGEDKQTAAAQQFF